jgi:6-phosphogluconolactonase (cycloisomerase 2 family)
LAALQLMPRLALGALALVALLAFAQPARAARAVYFADRGAGAIAQFAVGAGGAPSALEPPSVRADRPHRLAMTPTGRDLYATAAHGVLQFDVAKDGRLSPKIRSRAPAHGRLHSIAVHPAGHSLYVTDAAEGEVRQYDIGANGVLAPKTPVRLGAGPGTRGVAVSPDGRVLYVLLAGGIAVYDVGDHGGLTRRPQRVAVPSCTLQDLALTPDGARLYATARDGRIFGFAPGPDGTPVALTPAAVETPGASRPIGIAVAPDGSAVYVTAQGASHDAPGRVLSFAVGAGGGLLPAGDVAVAESGSKLSYLATSPNGRNLFIAGDEGQLLHVGPGLALAADPSSIALERARGVVVSPNQAPVASFLPVPGRAGSPTRFDASAAADPDGTIVRYDWDFGDGTRLADGGPSPQHVYLAPGLYAASLVVTDNEGASTSTVFTGGTVLGNGAPGARATRRIQVLAAVAAQPPAPGPPTPDLGETLVARPVSGTVLVRRPGRRRFVPLREVQELPLGSVLDARRGRVRVATERRRRRGVQNGLFYGGRFAVLQRARERFVTDLVLRGRLDACAAKGDASAAAPKRRRLWGKASGRFRTRGRYSSGAVRGTRWLTVDRCAGTLTVVREGRVAVRDFGLRRTVVVRAGERYLARPR